MGAPNRPVLVQEPPRLHHLHARQSLPEPIACVGLVVRQGEQVLVGAENVCGVKVNRQLDELLIARVTTRNSGRGTYPVFLETRRWWRVRAASTSLSNSSSVIPLLRNRACTGAKS